MEAIKISKERMEVLLPQNIKESDAISYNSKKLLATLINYFVTLDKVKEQGYLYLSNDILRESLNINKNEIFSCIAELKDHDLIEREAGQTRQEGKKSIASKYIIKWGNLKKELKKLTFEDIFSTFMNNTETPFGTADIDINIKTNIKTNTETNIDTDSEEELNIKTNSKTNKKTETKPYTDTDSEEELNIKTNSINNARHRTKGVDEYNFPF